MKVQPLTILLLAAVIVPLMFFGVLTWSYRERALASGEREVERTLLVLREHAHRVFETQELVIDRVDRLIAGMSWEEIAESRAVHEGLAKLARSIDHLDGLWVVNAEGAGVNGADFFPMRTDTRERDYYQALVKRDVLYFGSVIVGKLKGNLNFNLSRRRGSPTEQFDGLILATASIDYFVDFWRTIGSEDDHVAGLFRSDGEILARYPAFASVPPRLAPESPLIRALQRNPVADVYWANSPLDGARRVYGYSRVGDYPLYVGYGLDQGALLAPWRQQTLLNGAITAIVVGMLLFLVLLATREQRKERAANVQLRQEVAKRQEAESLVHEKERLLADLDRAHAERTAILDSMVEGMSVVDRDLRVLYRNQSGRRLLSLSTDAEVPVVRAQTARYRFATLHGALLSDADLPHSRVLRGEEVKGLELALTTHKTGQRMICRYNGAPLRNAKDEIVGSVVTFEDVTEAKAAEERQQLLVGELNHRVRNLLATIQSMVSLTGSGAVTKEEFQRGLLGRIGAIARSHTLLSKERWRGAGLQEIVLDELQPYQGEGRILLEADTHVWLRPREAQTFALIVHELATNAAKYGALSVPEGRLRIGWRLVGGPAATGDVLRFEWQELDGPPVAPPTRRGFGTRMIERALKSDGGADVTIDFAVGGLCCRIDFPLENIVVGGTRPGSPGTAGSRDEAPHGRNLAGSRILLAEDEVLLALELELALRDAGIAVEGPVTTVSQGLALLRADPRGDIDAACVDLNLSGEISGPLIERLIALDIPVLVTSGYEDIAMLPDFVRALPRLRKPFSPEALLQALGALVRAHRNSAE